MPQPAKRGMIGTGCFENMAKPLLIVHAANCTPKRGKTGAGFASAGVMWQQRLTLVCFSQLSCDYEPVIASTPWIKLVL